MLEILAGNKFFCFLDGFSSYFQIPIEPVDQEKTTFTCPYGTYADEHMPFGLCNAPTTFQSSSCSELGEVSLHGDRLNYAWTQFSSAGLEVDKAKIDVIAKLPLPINVKAVRSFLGHADWSQPFELMCDAINFAVGAVLRQREGKHFHPIHFASKTLNNTQQNYTVTKKELLIVVFAFDKFRSYLILSKTVVFIDHSALKYMFAKQDAKPCLIRWILLLQEFDIKFKNKKGAKNVAADHLLRLENPHPEELRDDDIDDNFPDETLMNVSSTEEAKIPWFANFANYLVGKNS
ncbi:reverse transcriptase domain-containing protein [Tanacetum coccineum]